MVYQCSHQIRISLLHYTLNTKFMSTRNPIHLAFKCLTFDLFLVMSPRTRFLTQETMKPLCLMCLRVIKSHLLLVRLNAIFMMFMMLMTRLDVLQQSVVLVK